MAPTVPTTASPPLLLLEQVSKWYGPVLSLNQVTLELGAGITGLVGPNGSGKSTLIKLATGLIRPTLGRVSVRGLDASDWRSRHAIGYCPDHDAFYEEMSGREFVRTMAKLNGFAARDVAERSEAVLVRVGMVDRADRKIRGYSKGMRQRIKLAQALLHDPELLILDEPLSGIDPLGRRAMLDLFRSLAEQGKCLLISSHELEELEKLTDRVAILARGRIASVGTLQQIRALFDDFPMSVRVVLDHPRELAKHLLGLEGVLGFDLIEDGSGLTIRARNPDRFFAGLGALLLDRRIAIRELEPLDDSAHAILGYLLGGSGKT